MPAVLDAHAAIWYLLDAKQLSRAAGALIDQSVAGGNPVCLSAISLVEVVYLAERDRIAKDALDRLLNAVNAERPSFRICPVDSLIAQAMQRIPRDLVSDMPDRIIAATALYLGIPLVTRDVRLRAAGIQTIW